MDYYFKNNFLKRFDDKYASDPNAEELIPFGHNARTTCIAFVGFAARYHLGNINNEHLKTLFANSNASYSNCFYDILRNLDGVDYFFPSYLMKNKDKFDDILFELFEGIIKAGKRCFAQDKRYDTALNATNYLKKDVNYYNILKIEWDQLSEFITKVFEEVDQDL